MGNTSAPKIEFTNSGSIGFSGAGARTLVLRGSTIADNLFAPQIINNGTDVTSVSKSEAGLWILSNNANSYSGGTTITGVHWLFLLVVRLVQAWSPSMVAAGWV